MKHWHTFLVSDVKILLRIMVVVVFMQLFQSTYAEAIDSQSFVLSNGMKVVVKEDHRSPNVINMVWYKVGSMDELSSETGIAHVMEHMMFKGTPRYPEGTLSKLIAELGGQDNAFTNTDYTAYFQKIPSVSLEKMIDLEADRMKNLKFSQDAFNKEIKVVMEERRWRTEDRPEGVLGESLRATAFMVHPYRHPVIGWMGDLRNLQSENVHQWYGKWYAPNNATLVVVGDVNTKHVVDLAKKYFGKISSKNINRLPQQIEPAQKGIKRLSVSATAENPVVVLAYKVPSLRNVEKDTDVYALNVLAYILDGYENARLSASLIRKNQIAVSVSADYSPILRGPSLFVMQATPVKDVNVNDIEKQLREQIQEIAKNGITQSELQRVKSQLVASQIYKRDSIFGQALEIGVAEMTGIGHNKVDRIIEKLKEVTAQQVQKVAMTYFKDESLTVAVLVPQKQSKQPTKKQIIESETKK